MTTPLALPVLRARMETGAAGVRYLYNQESLAAYPRRLSDCLVHWAAAAPDRWFIAQRGADGVWDGVSYAQMLERARRVGAALLERGLDAARPVAILSGNSLTHLTLAMGAMWAGVPYASVSPAYSLQSRDFEKLRHVMAVLTPGLVYAEDGAAFGPALNATVPEPTEVVVGNAGGAGERASVQAGAAVNCGDRGGVRGEVRGELRGELRSELRGELRGRVGAGARTDSVYRGDPAGDARCEIFQAAERHAHAEVQAPVRIEGLSRPCTPWSALLVHAPDATQEACHEATGPDTVVKFLFTSGSTRLPKAVTHTHRMLCSNQQMMRQAFSFLHEGAPVLVDWLPWNHTFGGNHNLGLVLYNGGTLYIDEGRPTPAGMAATARNLREITPSVYFNVPKGFEELATAMEEDALLREQLFGRCRALFYAGAALSQTVWDRLECLALRTTGRSIRMFTGLGMTETSPSCTYAMHEGIRAGHVGLPCPGVEVKLVPAGTKMELCLRGPHVMPGYWRAPELTRAVFDEEGFYRSGDAVKFVDPGQLALGLQFDGRIAEDFKLATGSFVSVGPLRARIVQAGAPCVAEAVIAAPNRNEVGVLLFPHGEACRNVAGAPAEQPLAEVLGSVPMMQWLQALVDRLSAGGEGSASRVVRALWLSEPPSIDHGEVTDKGSINQRAVLEHRAALVELLYQDGPSVVRAR